MYEVEHIVVCPECSEEHDTEAVSFVNVEEDLWGRDVLHFLCPVTGQIAKSLVYRR